MMKESEPTPVVRKPAIVILGMHRSGTSALAHALSLCGFALPTDLMPAGADNPGGFFEPLGVVRLNIEILAAFQGEWHRPEPLMGMGIPRIETQITQAVLHRYSSRAIAALTASYGAHSRIVLKDPRITILLPLWRHAITSAGFTPVFVHIYRNPIDVARSLEKRNGLSSRRSFQLWQYHVSRTLELQRSSGNLINVSYDALLSNPNKVLADILLSADLLPTSGIPAAAAAAIKPESPHSRTGSETLVNSPATPALVRATWKLIEGWSSMPEASRIELLGKLRARLDDAMNFLAPFKDQFASEPVPPMSEAPAKPIAKPIPPPAPVATTPLLLHYHLFKNAGTSVDEMLKRNFGERWAEAEFRMPGANKASNADDVASYIAERPHLTAFSSHTALLPVPKIPGRIVFPILFIRHPIDRLKSAYAFERKQDAETLGAKLAKEHDFAGYLRALLADPQNRQARNFQTYRLGCNEAAGAGTPLERALRTLVGLPFVGLVEEFDQSLVHLEKALVPLVPSFRAILVHKNKTHDTPEPLLEKLGRIKTSIGEGLYLELCSSNADDIEIFEKVRSKYDNT